MYECLECGKEFETPATDCDGDQLEKDIKVCPSCGSDDIEEVDDYDEDYLDDEEEIPGDYNL